MKTLTKRFILIAGTISAAALAPVLVRGVSADSHLPNLFPFPNTSGLLETYSSAGSVDLGNLFFQSLGTNGRSCATCHEPSDGWGVSAANVRLRFLLTAGRDPIFRTNDGSTCDTDGVSTLQARRQAYSLLLNKGLLRIAMAVPTDAEFQVVNVQNPYGCNSTTTLSVYRRPLPAANLRFLSTVMWDGRESHPGNTLEQNLESQAQGAILGHAQGNPPGLTEAQLQQIVAFETSLYTAQAFDYRAGMLNFQGAKAGPVTLSQQQFFIGINDPLGLNPTGAAFDPKAMKLFDGWAGAPNTAARQSIARGEALFNTKPISITGVAGLNDALNQPTIAGTCTTCHDSFNVGDHSVGAPLDVGVANPALAVNHDLPVITLVNKMTHATVQTTDPGRALVTGKWSDIGKFKGPILRGLAARAPYFHNGSAASLMDVVNFYDTRFGIGFTPQEKTDMVAFLSTL
ncbi:MAG TPA: hypothetical protein VG675_06265 [Bryobacteraceae bacterium]|nr:hypothetical protein [Bryobacteraceae bacterium]